jgi:hypothetical protein
MHADASLYRMTQNQVLYVKCMCITPTGLYVYFIHFIKQFIYLWLWVSILI